MQARSHVSMNYKHGYTLPLKRLLLDFKIDEVTADVSLIDKLLDQMFLVPFLKSKINK